MEYTRNTLIMVMVVSWIVVGSVGIGQASTVSGATGLITLGTADALPLGTAELGLKEHGGGLAVTAMYGLMPDVEVGIHMPFAGDLVDRVGLILKGVIAQETEASPGVAIGFETGRSYIVASKRIAPRLRFHGAYVHGNDEGPAAGLTYNVTTASVSQGGMAGPATTLLAEYTSAGLHLGARMLFGTVFSVDVAVLDMRHPTGGVGVRLTF